MPVPAALIIPVLEPILATLVVPEDHVPPVGALVSVGDEKPGVPKHNVSVPDIGDIGSTFTVVILRQPVGSVYVISVLPLAVVTGATMPEDEPIVATVVVPLAQVPPATVLLSVMLLLAHTLGPPVMAPGKLLTVTTAVALQPPLMV